MEEKVKKKKKKNASKKAPFKKMLLYIVIVNYGTSEGVLRLLEENGSNAQFVSLGGGTIKQDALTLLGLEDKRKDVIFAFVDESNVLDIQFELKKLFKSNKRYMGFAFTISLSSIVGEKLYHFLTNTL